MLQPVKPFPHVTSESFKRHLPVMTAAHNPPLPAAGPHGPHSHGPHNHKPLPCTAQVQRRAAAHGCLRAAATAVVIYMHTMHAWLTVQLLWQMHGRTLQAVHMLIVCMGRFSDILK